MIGLHSIKNIYIEKVFFCDIFCNNFTMATFQCWYRNYMLSSPNLNSIKVNIKIFFFFFFNLKSHIFKRLVCGILIHFKYHTRFKIIHSIKSNNKKSNPFHFMIIICKIKWSDVDRTISRGHVTVKIHGKARNFLYWKPASCDIKTQRFSKKK